VTEPEGTSAFSKVAHAAFSFWNDVCPADRPCGLRIRSSVSRSHTDKKDFAVLISF
jgi:hypothetical protein